MARTPCWSPTWPLDEDMQLLLHTRSCLWPRGLLPCVPTHSRSTSSTMPWQGSVPLPLALGGQFTPRILPLWPSDCLVLQLSLPCALGDPLAVSSWEPRPQTPPTLQFETPSPNECSPAARAACTLHMLVSSTAPPALACPPSDPFLRIPGHCLLCSQQPSSSSPAGTWRHLSSLQFAAAQA